MFLKIGNRVRVTKHLGIFLLGDFPVGTTGTVVQAHPDPVNAPDYAPIALVRLDALVKPDNPWSDLLQVFANEDSLEVIQGLPWNVML